MLDALRVFARKRYGATHVSILSINEFSDHEISYANAQRVSKEG